MIPAHPRARPPEHYRAVARLWLDAWAERGGRPTLAVAQHYGVPHSTAARWVKRARQLGILTQPYRRAHTCPGCGAKIQCERGE